MNFELCNSFGIGYLEYRFEKKKELRNNVLNEWLGKDDFDAENFIDEKVLFDGQKQFLLSIKDFVEEYYAKIIQNRSFYFITLKNSYGDRISLKFKILFVDSISGEVLNSIDEGTFNISTAFLRIIFIDYTADKKIDEKARLFDYQFRGTFEKANIGMAIISVEGRIIESNYSFCHFLGLNNIEIKEVSFQEITVVDDLLLDMKHLNSCLSGEIDSYTIEKRYYHKNGNIVWGRLTATLIRDVNKEPLYFISHIEDITDLKLNLKILNETNNELKSIINSNPYVVMLTTNLQGQFRNINKSYANITKFNIDDVASKNVLQVFDGIYDTGDNGEIIGEKITSFESLKNAILIQKKFKFIANLLIKDSKPIRCEARISMIKNEKEENIGLVFVAFDSNYKISFPK